MTAKTKKLPKLLASAAAIAVGGFGALTVDTAATAQESPALAEECSAPWSSDATYTEGDKVNHDGREYRARWWTEDDRPDTAGEWGAWLPLELCGESGVVLEECERPWMPGEAYQRGQYTNLNGTAYRAQWWTEGVEPGTTGDWGVWEEAGSCREPVSGTYFTYWDDYWPVELIESGQIENLTHLNYAFARPSEEGTCELGGVDEETGVSWDTEYMVPAEDSVDGVADTPEDEVRGYFGQLIKLKEAYPHLNIVLSVGGEADSANFAVAMEDLEKFAQSCYDLAHDPRWDGLFDGIDIDWEFPNLCLPWTPCDESGWDAPRLMAEELRTVFGDEIVSFVGPINPFADNALEVADWVGTAEHVDYFNLVTFHYEGDWSATTSADAAVYSPTGGLDIEDSVNWYLDRDVDASKLVIAYLPWAVVWQEAEAEGFGQAHGGSHPEYQGSPYRVTKETCADEVYHEEYIVSTCWDGENWWSFDSPESVAGKTQWAVDLGLGGLFNWNTSLDSTGELRERAMDGLYA
ncbi:glycosyl hydrolase family 18 protein [Salininema proteolyticum]|uniref:chitinase n=1 Tax=Salininema proteolyticum TaxID=1607685 RepID=A0ABV8TWR3_9ACTN